MKLHQQISTLPQSKKLKELGVAQGYSCWSHLHLPETKYRKESQIIYTGDQRFTDIGEENSAFDVAELGVLLSVIHDGEHNVSWFTGTAWGSALDGYSSEGSYRRHITYGNTEAEARADMLIYLLENNIVLVDEVNQRLQS